MVREGDIPKCSGKSHDPGKPAFRRLGILPQQLKTSPLSARMMSLPGLGCKDVSLPRRSPPRNTLDLASSQVAPGWVNPDAVGRVGRRISAHAIGAYRTIPGTRSKSESLLARLVSLW